MRSYPMVQVDVFTRTPLTGNPLAVFPEAAGLQDAEMQAIAREMNLSETTFVLPADHPDADYRVRIFTPASELPFAGHPTIGTAHVMVETGRVKTAEQFTLRQQTLAGVQSIEVSAVEGPATYTMTQPTPRFSKARDRETLCRALRVEPARLIAEPLTVSVGVAWHVVPLRDLETVRSLFPDMSALAELEAETGIATTVFCPEAESSDCKVRLRSFAPAAGIPEDPVCGSGNGCVGAYLVQSGLEEVPLSYRAEQGSEVGRSGRVTVAVDRQGEGLRVRVGGNAVSLLSGELTLPEL